MTDAEISLKRRRSVWYRRIGIETETSKCLMCNANRNIYIDQFRCVKIDHDKGIEIDNLLPVCVRCEDDLDPGTNVDNAVVARYKNESMIEYESDAEIPFDQEDEDYLNMYDLELALAISATMEPNN